MMGGMSPLVLPGETYPLAAPFTLTLGLSHRGRGDAPLHGCLRGYDGDQGWCARIRKPEVGSHAP